MFDVQTVLKVKELLLAGLDSTQVESEVQMYLLALKNALLPESVPLLAKYAESEVGAYSTIAITALQRFDPKLITPEVHHQSPISLSRGTHNYSSKHLTLYFHR